MTTPVSSLDLAQLPQDFAHAVDAIRKLLPQALHHPTWAIICGSGLATLGGSLLDKVEVPYSAIPGFAQSSVEGHKNALAFGFIPSSSAGGQKVPVVAALGRFHLYEGYTPQQCVFPTRVMRCLGAKAIVVTNASGGINPSYRVGDIVALHDHLSLPTLTALNPLCGPNWSALGSRFPPTSDAYDPALRMAFFVQASRQGLLDLARPREEQDVREGTYAYVSGPTYESRAECAALQQLGADCVGMSTVPEILAARHCGLRVLAISLITNKVVVTPYADTFAALVRAESGGRGGDQDDVGARDQKEAANHLEVLEVGKQKSEVIKKLVEGVIGSVTL